MKNIKKEIVTMKRDMFLYGRVECSAEEIQEYQKAGRLLPANIYNEAGRYYKYVMSEEVSHEEFQEYLMLTQTKYMKNILFILMIFAGITVAGIVLGIIAFYGVI